ncbi:pantoate--beta-alanine ligase [bacterium]|nr:pantoate--beta-alanine ligase [bacterium]
MKVIKKINEMQFISDKLRTEGMSIGFVPTMGYLHEGHISLVEALKSHCDFIVMSIFVNPAQFGPNEDFMEYPRDFENDKKRAAENGVDVIFYPSAKEMYKEDFLTSVRVKQITETMCGISRPTHFEGVATVVLKLFNIVKPHTAVFGQKDYQQSVVIRKMVEDLNVDVKIIVAPIIREDDGLAMSSRNKYLIPEERKEALVLYKSLILAKKEIERGETNSRAVIKKMEEIINGKNLVKIDYIKIADPDTLQDLETVEQRAVIAVAAFAGSTRLIDNILIT